MAKNKVLASGALLATVALSGCATTLVSGIGVEKTDNFENNRDSVVVEAYAKDHATGKLKPATATFYQDQIKFEGDPVQVPAEETYYKVVADDKSDLSNRKLRVVVSTDNPEDEVFCAIKDTGIFEPNHGGHSEGKGSATCDIQMH